MMATGARKQQTGAPHCGNLWESCRVVRHGERRRRGRHADLHGSPQHARYDRRERRWGAPQGPRIQDKYDVRSMTYWFDHRRGTGFCPVDAPDAASAERVHRAAGRNSDISSSVTGLGWSIPLSLDPVARGLSSVRGRRWATTWWGWMRSRSANLKTRS